MMLKTIKKLVMTIAVITVAGFSTLSSLAQQEAVEFDINRPGSDYRNFTTRSRDYRVCQRACDGDRRCKAWTYVKLGIQGRTARCWLKSDVPPTRASKCCVSGYKPSPRTSWHDTGYKVVKPRGGESRKDSPSGYYEVLQNRGTRITRTNGGARHRDGRIETLRFEVTLENMPGRLVLGQPARIRLKGSVVGYILPAGRSATVMRGNVSCKRGCSIVHRRNGKMMKGFELSDRDRKFDFDLEIRPPNKTPTRLPIFPIEIELWTRGATTLWTYRPG